MKVQELGTEITDVPGIEYIRIEPDEHGVHARVMFFGGEAMSSSIEELEQVVTAFQAAQNRLEFLASHQGNE